MCKLSILAKELQNIENSFLGIDGGNIDSKIWFCGIEFGGNIYKMAEYYADYVKFKENNGHKIPYRIGCPKDLESSIYDLYISEFIINLWDIKNTNRKKYLMENLYNQKCEIFKLNLYPLAKKNASTWDENITKEFNIIEEDYYNEYFDIRKKFLKNIINKYKPKKIICNVVKNSEHQFVEAFFDKNIKIEYTWEYVKHQKKKFKISEYSQNGFTLIIIPFLGMGNGNINSYDDVAFMANHLKHFYLKKELK